MADNPPELPRKAQPPLPSSGATGRLKAPTTKLPPAQPNASGNTGKIVVMLSSVAKPTTSQNLLPPGQPGITKVAPPLAPPPLPPKKIMPVATPLPPQQRLSSTTFVKLPPKTTAPAFVSMVPKAASPADPTGNAPPLLPPKAGAPLKPAEAPRAPQIVKTDLRKTSPIILNPVARAENKKTGIIKLKTPAEKPPLLAPDESIFAEIPEPPEPPVPDGWNKLHTGELPLPSAPLKDALPSAPAPTPAKAPTPPPIPTAPPLAAAPPIAAKPEPVLNPAPIALPPASPVNVAPPLLEKGHDEPAAKLPPPLPPDPAKGKEALKKSAPIALATTTRIPMPSAVDGKPSLRPAVLPSRIARSLADAQVPPPAPEADPTDAPDAAPPILTAKAAPDPAPQTTRDPALPPPALKTESAPNTPAIAAAKPEPAKESPLAAVTAAAANGAIVSAAAASPKIKPGPAAPAKTEPSKANPARESKAATLPPTRAERAKKRHYRGIIAFWICVPIAAALLFFGILYFGRDTRAEGQVIPPAGMTLADEVWIVSDFTELASGVADDDAKERVPLQLAVQEAQDHVQRVQADIASREERIHLIRDDIQATKDEITRLVKKAQTDSQAIYDGQGRDLDDSYNAHMNALKQDIASRAALLKLTYTPDPAYPSPEVWANAYRLALYETPPGVDGVKEHQWIADQMKQWRDFEKSIDDRSEQMREKAAAAKQEAAPKITELNAKIDDLNGRIAGTQTEEEPLKAELTQAQSDLAQAQGAEAGLDDKYYGQLNALPGENISYHIPIRANGRFTWVPDNPFGEGEVEHVYRLFARAIRADGRQYWSMHEFIMQKNETTEITLEPSSFESTKQILRPNLPPDEIEQ